MKLTFLGTASCFPTPTRGVSCTALALDEGEIWLFDCGEGSQIQLQKCKNIRPGKVTKIFITHLHGDHLFGLPGLLCTLGNGCNINENKVVDLYGPYGLRKYLITSLELSRSVPSFKFNIYELMPKENQFPPDWSEWNTEFEYSGQSASKVGEVSHAKIFPVSIGCTGLGVLDSKDKTADEFYKSEHEGSNNETPHLFWNIFECEESAYSVKAGALKHRIPSFGYVIEEKDKPGKLNVSKLQKELGLTPGPIFGQIKSGKVIELDNGIKIHSDEFLGPSKKGRKVSILGDTCDSSGLIPVCNNSDLLLHESTMENALVAKAIEYGHSTPEMAAKFAVLANSNKLCLIHLSPRYRPKLSLEFEETERDINKSEETITSDILKNEAEQYLRTVDSKIEVVVADDFLVLPVLKAN